MTLTTATRPARLCREVELNIISDLRYLCLILCYPVAMQECCSKIVEDLKRVGVTEFYSYGPIALAKGINVVGKGHASIVVLARHERLGLVAVKVRRADSKRESLVSEGGILTIAQASGHVPRVYYYSTNFIVREFVDGPTLALMLKNIKDLKPLAISLLKASRAVDMVNVDLVEVSRPHKQVVFRCGNVGEPFFVDLDSARVTPNPTNVTKVLSFILSLKTGPTFTDKPAIDPEGYRLRLRDLAKKYARSSGAARNSVFNEILSLIESAPSELFQL